VGKKPFKKKTDLVIGCNRGGVRAMDTPERTLIKMTPPQGVAEHETFKEWTKRGKGFTE